MKPTAPAGDALCLACGLCCDGTLFADVELQPGDAPERLRAGGLRLLRLRTRGDLLPDSPRLRFNQPCAALGADCHCRIYPGRPAHCRAFECALLKAFQAGTVSQATALRVIRQTRRRVADIQALLVRLGDDRKNLPLGRRFRELRRRMEDGFLPAGLAAEEAYERLADLMLAVQELQLTLRARFYPDPRD